MDMFEDLESTEFGRPKLLNDETEIISQDNIDLYDCNIKIVRNGRCILTSHRLFWIIKHKTDIFLNNKCIQLNRIISYETEPGFFKRSPKIRLLFSNQKYIKLSFKKGGNDTFYNQLVYILSRKEWIKTTSMITDKRLQVNNSVFSTTKAGISGIIRSQENELKKEKEIVSEACNDLQSLMDNAKDMITLIEKYTMTASQRNIKPESDEDYSINLFLLEMGLKSPVTRENAGTYYHIELAKQLAEFIKKYIEENNGILTLSDTYCIYNRARGTELISPDDLYEAAMLQTRINSGIHLRKFNSGLLVLQLDSYKDENIAFRLQTLAENAANGSISALDVSSLLNISITLALEYLKVAEIYEKLCRDESIEGLSFYVNTFNKYT